jgi:hypothetical protein
MALVSDSGKPDLKLSPRVKELLDLESRFTVGGFDPMPYFFREGSRFSAMGELIGGASGTLATIKSQ